MFETLVGTSKAGIKVMFRLYGTVTPERLKKEQQELHHRVNQFSPLSREEKEANEDFLADVRSRQEEEL